MLRVITLKKMRFPPEPNHRATNKLVMLAVAAGCLLAGCATYTPTRFYTLSAAPQENAALPKPASNAAPIYIDIAPVNVPERLKRPQIVVNTAGGSQLNILEFDRWSSPFNEELRDALASDISQQLNAVDISSSGRPANQGVYRVALVVRQLDAGIGKKLQAGFGWTITYRINEPIDVAAEGNITPSAICQLTVDQPAGKDINALVATMQGVVQQLANSISADILNMDSRKPLQCSVR